MESHQESSDPHLAHELPPELESGIDTSERLLSGVREAETSAEGLESAVSELRSELGVPDGSENAEDLARIMEAVKNEEGALAEHFGALGENLSTLEELTARAAALEENPGLSATEEGRAFLAEMKYLSAQIGEKLLNPVTKFAGLAAGTLGAMSALSHLSEPVLRSIEISGSLPTPVRAAISTLCMLLIPVGLFAGSFALGGGSVGAAMQALDEKLAAFVASHKKIT